MLATLNAKQIVDEIVKDTVKDNDPHDAVQISPDIVLASRPGSAAPALAPEIAPRPEPRFAPSPARPPEPTINVVYGKPAAAPPVDTDVRIAASDGPAPKKRSAVGKWARGAFVAFLFAGASVAASIAWEQHGDTAKKVLAEWTPVVASLMTSLMPATSQTAPVAASQPAAPPAQAAAEQATAPSAPPPPAQAAVAPAVAQPDPAQSVQAMTNDLAAMAQQIEQP